MSECLLLKAQNILIFIYLLTAIVLTPGGSSTVQKPFLNIITAPLTAICIYSKVLVAIF